MTINPEKINKTLVSASEFAMKIQGLALSISIAAHQVSTSLTDVADTMKELKTNELVE